MSGYCLKIIGLILALGVSLPGRAAEVTVFAAASLTDSLKEIGANYESNSTDHIQFNFGASSTLARQIQEGAPAEGRTPGVHPTRTTAPVAASL